VSIHRFEILTDGKNTHSLEECLIEGVGMLRLVIYKAHTLCVSAERGECGRSTWLPCEEREEDP
jgi:hypothetical protein